MTSTPNLSNLLLQLGGWANALPTSVRKRVYQGVKYLSALATLVLIVLPYLPTVGVNLPTDVRWYAAFTFGLSLLSHLADRNTFPDPLADAAPAPEVHPKDAAQNQGTTS